MNGKRIAKIISEEIMKSLYQFSDVITESYKCAPETNDYYRRYKYNMSNQTQSMRKIDSLKFGGYDKIGFDIEISEPTFNRRENYARDCPCLTVHFSNMSNGSVDPKTFAKIILFGFSTDFVYQIHYDDESDKPEFDVFIDHIEFGGSFNEIRLFFVRVDFKEVIRQNGESGILKLAVMARKGNDTLRRELDNGI